MKVAASPQSINRAMPEGGIQVTSHQSLVTPNPQSLATHPCFQTCGGGFAASIYGVMPEGFPFRNSKHRPLDRE